METADMKPTMIGVALLAALALAGCSHNLSDTEQKTASYGALQYSSMAGLKFISCSGQDSDGDSYVTCNAKEETGKMHPLLCSYQGSGGCKDKL